MSGEDASAEPIRKKARTHLMNTFAEENATVMPIRGTCAPSNNVQQRVDELSQKLSTFYKENPEMKYVMECKKLLANVKSAVDKYRHDVEAEANVQLNEKKSPLYSLPDEVLRRCMSYVGGKNYGFVALASKKLCKAYKEEYESEEGTLTSYKSAAASVNTAKYCIENLCRPLEEKDELFKVAAVNGNIYVLRYATSSGYDLIPILCSKEKGQDYEECTFGPENLFDSYISTKIVANGHLHILKYLHEELGYRFGSRAFCKPAMQHRKLEILEWLKSINALDDYSLKVFCITSGSLDILKWVQDLKFINGYVFLQPTLDINAAIASKSIDMIEYCLEIGNEFDDRSEAAVARTENLKLFRFCYDKGLEFHSDNSMHRTLTKLHYREESEISWEFLEIIKFLRSVGVQWPEGAMRLLLCRGSFELVQYAHENGLTMPNYNDIIPRFLAERNQNVEKLKYLIANNTSWESFLLNEFRPSRQERFRIWNKKDLSLLDCFVGKNDQLDNIILKEIIEPRTTEQAGRLLYLSEMMFEQYKIVERGKTYEPVWLEGVQFMFEKGKDIQIFIEDVVYPPHRPNMEFIKYLRTCRGCHWTRDKEKGNELLCRIACSLGIEDVKWAFENGCRGRSPIPFNEEQWDEGYMMRTSEWYSNYDFLQENCILGFDFQDVGDDFMYHDLFLREENHSKVLEETDLDYCELHLDLNLTTFLARKTKYGTLEMIQFAHENGCPWSSSEVISALLCKHDFSHEKFNYLMEIGCKIEYDRFVVDSLRRKNELDSLELFVGKNSTFDNALFKSMVKCDGRVYCTPPWLEGITFVLEKGKDIQNFQSIEEVFETCRTMDGLKYFHSLGLPWCLDTSRNNRLLSGIACYNKLDDVKWAYENGCNGGLHVKEEHIKEDHIKSEYFDSSKRENWNQNRSFFLENGLPLTEMNIPEKEISQLEAKYPSRDEMFFRMNYSTLKSLVDRGYAFRSQSEKERITKEALEKCMDRFSNADERKRLALFQKMGVSKSSSSK